MKTSWFKAIGVVLPLVAVLVSCENRAIDTQHWSESELSILQALWLDSLPGLSPDPSNAVADDPRAAQLGQRLFFDPRLSANGAVSCATCHQPERHFADGLPKGQAIGMSMRNTPSIVGTAYSPWLYWDGRKDSQWAQALSPLEDPNEHATNRLQVVTVIAEDEGYRSEYEYLFGTMPDAFADDPGALDVAFANVGKTIAAFERTIMPTASRFDRFIAALVSGDEDQQCEPLNDDEIRGLRLFIGKANCTQCHNGPLFTNNEFHNTGVLSAEGEVPDKGRVVGVRQVLADPFNCRGDFSDDTNRACDELEFARTGAELIGSVRTPSLRNLQGTAPFMHKGQIATIAKVLEHYNEAPDAMIGHNEAKSLNLSRRELVQLERFLATLDAPHSFQLDGLPKRPAAGCL